MKKRLTSFMTESHFAIFCKDWENTFILNFMTESLYKDGNLSRPWWALDANKFQIIRGEQIETFEFNKEFSMALCIEPKYRPAVAIIYKGKKLNKMDDSDSDEEEMVRGKPIQEKNELKSYLLENKFDWIQGGGDDKGIVKFQAGGIVTYNDAKMGSWRVLNQCIFQIKDINGIYYTLKFKDNYGQSAKVFMP